MTTTQSQSDDLFFQQIVTRYTDENPRYLPRPWLADEVSERLENRDTPFVLITAEPGFGKTVFMSQLAKENSDWLRYFIRRDQRNVLSGVDTRSFLLRIGYQLVARFPELFGNSYRTLDVEQQIGNVAESGKIIGAEVKKVIVDPFYSGVDQVLRIRQHIDMVEGQTIGIKIDELITDIHQIDLPALQNKALIDPARAMKTLHPEQRIVILIDALDEVRYHTERENILEWLTNLPELPSNVHFVLTARPPEAKVLFFLQKQTERVQHLVVDNDTSQFQDNIDTDAETYVDEKLIPLIADGRQHEEISQFREKVIEKADGNLGYLDTLVRSIDQYKNSGDDQMLDALLALEHLPEDMQALYGFFLNELKKFVGDETIKYRNKDGENKCCSKWNEIYAEILGVLTVAQEPLTTSDIRKLGSIQVEFRYVQDAIDDISPFLDKIDNRYRFYHATVPEFLTSDRIQNNTETASLYVNATDWHNWVSSYYWRTYKDDWSKCDDRYGLKYLATHLAQGEQDDRLHKLICQEWMKARFENEGFTYDGFIPDLRLAWDQMQTKIDAQIKADETPTDFAMCVRYALINSSINSLASNYTPEIVVEAVKHNLWSETRALSVLKSMIDWNAQLVLGTELLSLVTLDAKKSVAKVVLLAATNLEKTEVKRYLEILAMIVPYLSSTDVGTVLQKVLLIETGHLDRSKHLSMRRDLFKLLSSYVSLEHIQSAEDDLRNISTYYRLYGYRALSFIAANYSHKDYFQEALSAVRSSYDSRDLHSKLHQLATEFVEIDPRKALYAAIIITNEYSRALALSDLAPHFPREQQQRIIDKVLNIARNIQNNSIRITIFISLIPQLEQEQQKLVIDEAFESVQEILVDSEFYERFSDRYRPHEFYQLLPYLSNAQIIGLLTKRYSARSKSG